MNKIYILWGANGPLKAFAEEADAIEHRNWLRKNWPSRKFSIKELKVLYGQVM